jgi:hypothetical protein
MICCMQTTTLYVMGKTARATSSGITSAELHRRRNPFGRCWVQDRFPEVSGSGGQSHLAGTDRGLQHGQRWADGHHRQAPGPT